MQAPHTSRACAPGCPPTPGDVRGPITVVAGKRRRITFMECPTDLAGMMDAAKVGHPACRWLLQAENVLLTADDVPQVADLVLLLVDGAFGFEMETFEFLNLLQVRPARWMTQDEPCNARPTRCARPDPSTVRRCCCLLGSTQVAGFPKVMGVLTHLDSYKDPKQLKKTKKALKQRFWTEVYDGAKVGHGSFVPRWCSPHVVGRGPLACHTTTHAFGSFVRA